MKIIIFLVGIWGPGNCLIDEWVRITQKIHLIRMVNLPKKVKLIN